MLQYNDLEQTTYTPEAIQAMRSQGKPSKNNKRIVCKADRKAHSTFRKQRQQRHYL